LVAHGELADAERQREVDVEIGEADFCGGLQAGMEHTNCIRPWHLPSCHVGRRQSAVHELHGRVFGHGLAVRRVFRCGEKLFAFDIEVG
ncbi:MAG: hypothetical protein QOG65_3580, partial [Actinomycetota bacterium]|nr:hypothetical protein [Actinomycetota bacterium]